MVADEVPNGGEVQLLRSSYNPPLKQGGYMHQRCPRLAVIGVLSGQCDRRLTCVFCSAPHRRHQPRAAGDCLAPRFGVRQAYKQTPPVVDQRHCTRSKLAAMQIVRGEATFTLPPAMSLSNGLSDLRHGVPCKFRALTILAALPHRDASYPLPVRQASALLSASSRFAVTHDTLAVQLTLPLAGRVEGFHLQVSAPCRAHQ